MEIAIITLIAESNLAKINGVSARSQDFDGYCLWCFIACIPDFLSLPDVLLDAVEQGLAHSNSQHGR
jgi:hypothetical protein